MSRPNPHGTQRWRKLSLAYRQANPICEVSGCGKPSEATDHKDGLGPLGPRGYDVLNLMAMCWSHHSSKTATLDGGFGNRSKRPIVRTGLTW